jgi:hypothetical protein
MTRRALFAYVLAAALAALANGCCADCHSYACGGFGGVAAGPEPCSACGEREPCGGGWGLFGCCRHLWACNSGCGDTYCGEWFSDPPDCCDPCDCCGGWTGDSCCGPHWLGAGLCSLWGFRYMPHAWGAGCCDCGYRGEGPCDCSSCDGGSCGCGSCNGGLGEGEVIGGLPAQPWDSPAASAEPSRVPTAKAPSPPPAKRTLYARPIRGPGKSPGARSQRGERFQRAEVQATAKPDRFIR